MNKNAYRILAIVLGFFIVFQTLAMKNVIYIPGISQKKSKELRSFKLVTKEENGGSVKVTKKKQMKEALPYMEVDSALLEKIINNQFKVKAGYLPSEVSFAGESAPLNKPFIKEFLDREINVNTFWHSSTILTLKRAGRWMPIIEPILKEHKIPNDFKYLALIESGLQNVSSPAGASGYWQIMKGTAKEYGLEVNTEIDERYHVEKSTHAACKILNKLNKSLNNWTLSAAAYNAGKRRITKSLKDQKVDNYYDLLLNTETARYVFRILAMKLIYENPEKYGFYLGNDDLYSPIQTKEIKTKGPIKDWAAWAKKNNSNYKELRMLNPWIRKHKLTGHRKEYIIHLPA